MVRVGDGGYALAGARREISRGDLEALVEVSEAVSEQERHRLSHEGDWPSRQREY